MQLQIARSSVLKKVSRSYYRLLNAEELELPEIEDKET
jgi:hypothetical protein